MKTESNFRDSVKTTARERARDTSIVLIVIVLLIAVIFLLCRIAIHIAEPYLPVHKPGRAPTWELRR